MLVGHGLAVAEAIPHPVSAVIIPSVLPVIVVAGVLVGITVGALGAGGSILTVPALVYLLGQDPRAATTGSLIVVGTTTLIGFLPHARHGHVRLGQGLIFGALGVGGAYLGSVLSTSVSPTVLLAAFAVLMLIVAGLMVARRRAAARAARGQAAPVEDGGRPILTLRPLHLDGRAAGALLITATGVGLLTGFFGVGGGFAVVPALVLALRMPMVVAVGTSLVVITVNSVTALVSRIGQDVELDWTVVGVFTAVAVIGGLLGSRITARVSPLRLNDAFTVLLIVVAVYTASKSVAALL